MNTLFFIQSWRRLGTVVFGAAAWLTLAGCAIDTDAVVTDAVSGALTAAVNSLVEALSAYLAGT